MHFHVEVVQKQERNVLKKRESVKKLLFCLINLLFFFDVLFAVRVVGSYSPYLVEVFSGPSWLYPFGTDSLSRSVHYAPDENDRPSERTKISKITSVYVPVYISELTRT